MYRFELNRSVVGEGGLEPPRPEGHWHLKPARLPFRHSPVAADCSAGMFVGLGGPTDPRTITVGLVGIQTRLIRLVRAESEGAGWVCGCVWFRRGAARSSPSRLNQQWDAGRLVPRRPGSTSNGDTAGRNQQWIRRLNQQWDAGRIVPRRPGSTSNEGQRASGTHLCTSCVEMVSWRRWCCECYTRCTSCLDGTIFCVCRYHQSRPDARRHAQ